MHGQKTNRLGKSRDEWYQSHQSSSNSGRKKNKLTLSINFDTHTYTKTEVFKPFNPRNIHQAHFDGFEDDDYYYGHDKDISYWGKGGTGVEPLDFSRTLSILREKTAISPYKINLAPIGRINDCFTPYQNDKMTYDALEAARNELRHRAEHIALEMRRVDDAWNTEPAANYLLRTQNQSLEMNHKTRRSSVQHSSLRQSDSKRSKRMSKSFL